MRLDDSPTRLDLRVRTGDFAALRREDRPAGFAVPTYRHGGHVPSALVMPTWDRPPARRTGRLFLSGIVAIAIGGGLVGGALATGLVLAWMLW